MLILFFCLIFQRYANPYTDENVDRLEFAQLFFAHFLLFLGVVYFALAPNEDEACLALDALSLNATSADDVDQEERRGAARRRTSRTRSRWCARSSATRSS